MLAWLHQTAASEREITESLVLRPVGAAGEAAAASQTKVNAGIGPPPVAAITPEGLLDQIMEGTCRPLKVRDSCIVYYEYENEGRKCTLLV